MMPIRNWRQRVHRGMQVLSPRLAQAAQSAWQSRHARRVEGRLGLPGLAEKYLKSHGSVVRHGPFSGMHYLTRAAGSVLIPKLIGCYEVELHPHITLLQAKGFNHIIDIGAAEGYYAVGLARLLPEAQVTAYELNSTARRDCERLAILNNVGDRVRIQRRCAWEHLAADLQPQSLIFCDCEGFEWQLLDSERVPVLSSCHLLVELHSTPEVADVMEGVRRRFSQTHQIEFIEQQYRDTNRYDELVEFSEAERAIAISELRGGPQLWVYLAPKVAGGTHQ